MTNIASRLESQLDAISLRQLRGIAAAAEVHGAQTYLVGGAVRDVLLGLPVSDIDITVVGLTLEFAREAAKKLGGEIVARSQFNTFALSAAGRRIDMAMARHETYAHPGALPTVVSGSMEQDLARRDFSVNAMAASINADSFGELLDPFNGQSDLKLGVIRVLHDDSFRDDATRILRAARYAVRLGFRLDTATENLLRRDATYLDAISPARLRDEFQRVLLEDRGAQTLNMLNAIGALQAIHPALTLDSATLDALHRAELSDYADMPTLLQAVLVSAMNMSDQESFIDRLSLTSGWAQVIRDTGRARSRAQDDLSVKGLSRSEIYMKLRMLHEAAILACALMEGHSLLARRLMLYVDELRHIKPTLTGSDLIALGVQQGPRVGEILHNLLVARLDQELVTRQDEIEFVLERL